ncbi:hypothetical protein IEQ34_021667 [Dendrobium chrysotoxum]|uniref:Uncharacterized protein n=1 Tax=Dendrobium chrysotoxum TaxID=161865 RepID=A0AAV7FMX3_DENCH|nr:hypothetical protein IEQ34_021667 [Dendrobium chrysotoxum]
MEPAPPPSPPKHSPMDISRGNESPASPKFSLPVDSSTKQQRSASLLRSPDTCDPSTSAGSPSSPASAPPSPHPLSSPSSATISPSPPPTSETLASPPSPAPSSPVSPWAPHATWSAPTRSASLTLLTAPAVFLTSTISSPTGFLLARFFTGFSIASFVSTQYWMSSMFSAPRVGGANGLVGGWGNLGGGAIQLIMPFIFSLIGRWGARSSRRGGWRFSCQVLCRWSRPLACWRWGRIAPTGILDGVDTGNYVWILLRGGIGGRQHHRRVLLRQIRCESSHGGDYSSELWPGECGVEAWRRWISDRLAARFGMRGRLWGLWIIQTVGGVLCIVLGRMGSLSFSVLSWCSSRSSSRPPAGLPLELCPSSLSKVIGLISGMTGGGGKRGSSDNAIAILQRFKILEGNRNHSDGVMIVCCTLLITLIYFPQWAECSSDRRRVSQRRILFFGVE